MRQLNSEEFEKELSERVEKIELILQEALPAHITMQKTIRDAMEYSLMAGGKRLRPLLLSETYRLFGGEDMQQIHPFMAALEMIHTYSLVHDDLPAMDNDEYRRGRKTTHIVFGEDMGILAGDALLNYAYETAVKGAAACGQPERGLKALEILSEKAGVYGMVGGQVVDVELTGKPLEEEQLDFIYRLKTGALLEAAFMSGAALAGAGDEELQRMERIGCLVGQAFQIQDDILDIVSTTEELGKPVGSDVRNEKTTYVSLHGMDAAKKAVEEYSQEALELLDSVRGENPFLATLITALIHRKK
ncbi:MAG: polyprenyl synthetase family protein [Lachnospiraceae bacterium]|nr:polyprenyl synthetase family protein [Lachnospiraceae bacterium]